MKSLTEPGKKINRYLIDHPEVLVHRKAEGFSFPISAEIDLCDSCSLNCRGCHSKWMHNPRTLSRDQIARILYQLEDVGTKAVTFAGGGEPLESPFWHFAISTAHQMRFDIGVYTYFPEPKQWKVDILDDFTKFVYSHPFKTAGLKRKFRNETSTTWTCGFLLDSENWTRFPAMVDKVDLSFFDFIDFRPLAPINTPDPPMLDYKWVPRALELLQEFYGNHPQVRWAEYKFLDLMKPNSGRDYASCLSTDFTTLIGSDGSVYECLNRRGFADSILGNILTEDLADIWKRKKHSREDFTGCRILCRNHEENKTLYQLLGPPIQHGAFV